MSRNCSSNRLSQSGVSLLEVMISVLIMGVGLLGIAAMQAAALRNNQGAYGRSQAVIQSYAIIDAMRANLDMARSGAYNRALTCDIPGSGGLVDSDWNNWMANMKQSLGDGDATCGSVNCNANSCTVTVQWDDSHGTYQDAAAVNAAETRTFTTVTRL